MTQAPLAPRRPGSPRTLDRADLMARVILGSLFLALAIRIGNHFVATREVTGLLLLVSELLVVVFTIVRRPAVRVERSLAVRIVAAISVLGPPLVNPTAMTGLAHPLSTTALSMIGLLIVIAGKLSLGRSFGLMPAHRGIVCSGPYRWVRHPIYLGYMLTHVAFLLANPSAWNAVALIGADCALLVRMHFEERTLGHAPEYARYLARVRWRILPGIC